MNRNEGGLAIFVILLLIVAVFWKKIFGTSSPSVSSTVGGVPVTSDQKSALAAAISNPIPIYQSPAQKTGPSPTAPEINVTPVYATTPFPFAPDASTSGLTPTDTNAIQDASYNGGIEPVYT